MAVYNYVEDLVYNKMNELISRKDNVCRCDKCFCDMVAYAINGLPVIPYVTSDGGVFREVQNLANDKLKIEIATRCIRAIDAVGKNARHKKTAA